MKYLPVLLLLFAVPLHGQITTTCNLYGNTAHCVSTNPELQVQQQRQAFESGEAIGRGIGMAIDNARFEGRRRRYCAAHPSETFVYTNPAYGTVINGACASQDGQANEAASEWMVKHPQYVPSPQHGQAMDEYISEKRLARWDPKSYDKAYKALSREKKLTP